MLMKISARKTPRNPICAGKASVFGKTETEKKSRVDAQEQPLAMFRLSPSESRQKAQSDTVIKVATVNWSLENLRSMNLHAAGRSLRTKTPPPANERKPYIS
ncbi:hypothetical protein CDAR_69771 [Caerostris darwini]|uniref:Uncharacterized protein n=1 Tax=Caerostris darwini TaxID=1538125 RepID=A0AAV4U0Y2_9ARAC|nr:hypothetical protein CDAR_69771 [Caerostris darwini]